VSARSFGLQCVPVADAVAAAGLTSLADAVGVIAVRNLLLSPYETDLNTHCTCRAVSLHFVHLMAQYMSSDVSFQHVAMKASFLACS
jgi:hypothetical protein